MCQWTASPAGEDAVLLSTLWQEVDAEAVRASSMRAHTTVQPSDFTVQSAISAVFNAAASLSVEGLVKEYNKKARTLFDTAVKARVSHDADYFQRLFEPVSLSGGGYVLLKATDAPGGEQRIEGTVVAPSMKRVRLGVIHDDGLPQHVVPTVADAVKGALATRAYPGSALKLEVGRTDYEVVAGHLSTLGSGVVPLIGVTSTPIRVGLLAEGWTRDPIRGADPDIGDPEVVLLPSLIPYEEWRTFWVTRPHGCDPDVFLQWVQNTASARLAEYRTEIRTLIDNILAARAVANPGLEGNAAEQALAEVHQQVLEYLRDILSDRERHVLCYATAFYQHDGSTAPEAVTGRPARDDAIDLYTWHGMHGVGGLPRGVRIGDLQTVFGVATFAAAAPAVDTGKEARTPAVVLGPAYRSQVQRPENERRFRLHLLAQAGLNPALWGHEDTVGQFDVDEDRDQLDFDSAVKSFEHDLKAHSDAGYRVEHRRLLHTILGVVFTRTPRPDPKSIEVLGTHTLKTGPWNGFVYTPAVTRSLRDTPSFRARFRMPIHDAASADFVSRYPTWAGDGEAIASAALFVLRHAVARTTTPFEDAAYMASLDEVAAMIAQTNAFEPYQAGERAVCTKIADAVCAYVDRQLLEHERPHRATMLHLIQLTGPRAAVGRRDFPQPFDPLHVEFPGATLTDDRKLRYTIGSTGSTDLLEAITVALELLRSLSTVGADPVHPTEVPMPPYAVPVLPDASDEKVFKHRAASEVVPEGVGMCYVYRAEGSLTTRIDYTEYLRFIGFEAIQHNKAGRFMSSVGGALPVPDIGDVRCGTGTFPVQGGMSRTEARDDDDVMGPFEVREGLDVPVSDDNPSASFLIPEASAATHRRVLSDFIHYDVCTNHAISDDMEPEPLETIDVPLYLISDYEVAAVGEPVLVGYVRIEHARVVKTGNRAVLEGDRIKAVTAVVPNLLERTSTTQCRFVDAPGGYQYAAGFYFSAEYAEELWDRRLPDGSLRRFYPLLAVDNTTPMEIRDDAAWRLNTEAYTSYWPARPIVSHKRRLNQRVKVDDIVDQLKHGFQGFHFTNTKALNRTVFAVAVGQICADIKAWYEQPNDPGLLREPRAIHFGNPASQEDARDAELMRMVRSRDLATRVPSALAPPDLVTELVVFVRGPGRDALETPCVVHNVYAKTDAFRQVESDLMQRIGFRLSATRGIPKGSRPDCLARTITAAQARGQMFERLRQIVRVNARFVPSLANLMLRLRDFRGITKHTDKSRNRQAIDHATSEIQDAVFSLLYTT